MLLRSLRLAFKMVEVSSLPAPRVVGALACQHDSYLRSLKTHVVSCVKSPPPAPTPKAAKTKQAAGRTKEAAAPEETWMIECADSVLFPEGKCLVASQVTAD